MTKLSALFPPDNHYGFKIVYRKAYQDQSNTGKIKNSVVVVEEEEMNII